MYALRRYWEQCCSVSWLQPWHSLGFPLLLKLWQRHLTRPIHSRASAAHQCSPSLDSSQDEIPTASPDLVETLETFRRSRVRRRGVWCIVHVKSELLIGVEIPTAFLVLFPSFQVFHLVWRSANRLGNFRRRRESINALQGEGEWFLLRDSNCVSHFLKLTGVFHLLERTEDARNFLCRGDGGVLCSARFAGRVWVFAAEVQCSF